MSRQLGRWGMGAVALLVVACGPRKETDDTAMATGTATVTDIDLGRSVNPDKTIADETDSFRAGDTVYVSVETDAPGTVTLAVRWSYEDGQLVDESTQTVSTGGKARTEFHVSRPGGWPAGKYWLEVLLDGKSAGTKEFKVE